MPPAHIFIARHGERMDHIDPNFGKTYPRPHDSPLTENGIAMAQALGAYLVHHHHIDLSNTVILTSPLTRCVQTSAGIVDGALKAVGDSTQSVPVYLEPAIMEGAYWIFRDMSQNPAVVNLSTGEFHCPEPVFYTAPHHHAQTSSYVQLENPYPLYPPFQFAIEDHKLTDRTFPDRCSAAARKLLTLSELDGKTVVLVAHGETVLRAMWAMQGIEPPAVIVNPRYTAFTHLTCEGSGADTRVQPSTAAFDTPHLPEPPSEH